MPNRERKRVPDDRSDILKGSLLKSPPAHPWDTKNPSIRGHTRCVYQRAYTVHLSAGKLGVFIKGLQGVLIRG